MSSPHQWPSGFCCRKRFSCARAIARAISWSVAEYDSETSGCALGKTIRFFDGFGMSILRGVRCSAVLLSGFPREMPVAAADAVKHNCFAASAGGLWLPPEIKLNRLPSIATLRLQAKAGGRLVTAVHHAILATAVACDALHDAVSVPFRFLEQFRVARVMPVGHEIAGPFPPANISRWNRPG